MHKTGFQRVPFRRRNHHRQRVEVPRARHRGAVTIRDGLTVRVGLNVGDAVVVDQASHHGAELLETAAAALADAFGQFDPRRPDIACRVDEFVVPGTRVATGIEQSLLRPRRAIFGQQVVDVVRIRSGKCHHCRTVRTRRRSRMPGAPTSVDWRACFSRISDRSTRPGVNPVASNRRPRRDSASTALTGGLS